jgi:predicted AlkP superfamily phosphohydrolase/phosphomutase
MADRRRVVVLGLDAATLDLVQPWVEQGKLPTFRALMAEGVWGTLWSTVPPQSPPAWTSFMTGKNPGKHGVFDFTLNSLGGRGQLVNFFSVKAETLWHMLSRIGRKVGVINVPVTFPATPVNGFLVSGFLAPRTSEAYAYPRDVMQDTSAMNAIWMDHSHRAYVAGDAGDWEPGEFIAWLDTSFDVFERTVLDLYAKWPDCDFFMAMLPMLDTAQHNLWRYMDPAHPDYNPEQAAKFGGGIEHFYQRADQFVARFRTQLPTDTTLLIMSDHGQGPRPRHQVALNDWLRAHGYLALRPRATQTTPVSRVLGRIGLSWESWKRFLDRIGVFEKARLFYRQRLSIHSKNLIRGSMPREQLDYYDIDWTHTRAAAVIHDVSPWQGIWINTGDDSHPATVGAAEYEALRDELIRALGQLTDPADGHPLVERVYRREELYKGDYLHLAPDLYVRLTDDHTGVTTMGHPALVSPAPTIRRNGQHRDNGLVFGVGPGVTTGKRVDGRIEDIAPTVLHLLGLPVPTDMDGRVLTEMFSDPADVTYTEPSAFSAPEELVLSDEEREQVEQRLKGLGYLE